MNRFFYYLTISLIMFFSCADEDKTGTENFNDWTITGSGLVSPVNKKVLSEFVGSTNCPYCPEQDELLNSYFDNSNENYVGSTITDNWFVINYHTYHPSMWDPMYLFLRGETADLDFCYIRFGDGYGTGDWYNVGGVPTIYTNGLYSGVNENMAVGPMSDNTPIALSLEGTDIDGADITVQVSVNSSRDMSDSDSLHLFIAATISHVGYTGYNGQPEHEDVFLGWITDGLEGELLSLKNEEISKTYTWSMPSNWPESEYAVEYAVDWNQVEYDISHLSVVAFIQNKYSKVVLQVDGIK